MRSLGLLGTVALVVGCASGDGGQRVEGKVDRAHSHHAASASSSTPIHPHSHLDSVPAAYHGVYDISPAACARPSIQRLTVSARELRFHESVGSVRSVGFGGSGAIAVEADYEGEGQRWRSLRILSLAENGARLTVKGEGDSLDRIRCSKAAR